MTKDNQCPNTECRADLYDRIGEDWLYCPYCGSELRDKVVEILNTSEYIEGW